MKIRAIFRVQAVLLLVLVISFLANFIYCVISFAQGTDEPTVTSWDLVESVGLLVLGIGLLVAFLSYSATGWWVVMLIASALCIYDIMTVLVFEVGSWRYLYSFVVAIFYAALSYTMLGKSLTEEIAVSPHRIAVIPKLFFSAAVAFLFMFIVGSELLSLFIGVLTLTLLSEKVSTRTIERAKQYLSNSRGHP